ncbi:MAG: sugar phosphate permease [uncultured archaeon A07HB70]|nr:MAG: sugar phosphate permease [uncultured archaeon A07HB70]
MSTLAPARLSALRERLSTLDVLALTAGLWFLAKFLRYALPPLFPTFRETYAVSNTQLGLVFTGLLVGYAAMQFPSGALADRVGTVAVITGGAVLAALGAALLFLAPAFSVLVVAVVLVGVGTGAHKTVAITLLSTVYADRTGGALGVMDTVGESAGVVAPALVAVLLAATVDWRLLFLGGAVAALALGLAFRRRVATRAPAPAGDGADDDAGMRAYLAAFRAPRFLTFSTLAVVAAFVISGLVSFLPLYLSDGAGLTAETASLLYSGFFVAAGVQPFTGDVADRLGPLRVVAALLGLATACLAALVLGSGTLALGASVLGLGVGLHGFRPVRDAHFMTVIPDDVAGGTLGVVRTAMLVSAAAAPATVGYLSDVSTFRVAFTALVGAAAVATLAAVALAVTR